MKIVCLVYQNILKGDKTTSVANYAITAVYYIYVFNRYWYRRCKLLVVGYIYMTVDMVKTEYYSNIKYASMEIIDNSKDFTKNSVIMIKKY